MVEILRSHNLLYPPFRKMVVLGLEKAHTEGLYAYIFESMRLRSRQGALYAQGRTTPGHRVTDALPGESWHQYGLAVDLVFDGFPAKPGIQWQWEGHFADAHNGDYKRLAKIMKGYGLEWLGDSNIEMAHFQKTWGVTIKEAQKITETDGVLALWARLDKIIGGNA